MVAVQVMVPVIGLIVIGLETLPGGSVYPGHGVFSAFNGCDKLQYSESPSGSKGNGLYCQGVFDGKKIDAGTRNQGVELLVLSKTVTSVCRNILWLRGVDMF